jgi:proteasome lid subunit RPN8/RPN11
LNLTKTIKQQALDHANEAYPKEAVGLVHVVKGRNRYYKCKNIADTPDEHFVLDPKDYLLAEQKGEITAIIHSHPKTSPEPSPADQIACEKSDLPWFIVNPKTEEWKSLIPQGYELPYVGRQFFHGIIDCYSLVRDFYKREFNIELYDYTRRDQWWEKGENMYLDNFAKEGFKQIELGQVGYGDLFLMQLESPVPNHAAIYLNDGILLHHVQGRLSSRDVFGGYYQKVTAKILKHESR